MSDDQLGHDIARGHRAQQLIDDELLKEVIETMKSDYIKGWANSNPAEKDGREMIYLAYQQIGKLEQRLHSIANSGKVAQGNLDHAIKQKALRVA